MAIPEELQNDLHGGDSPPPPPPLLIPWTHGGNDPSSDGETDGPDDTESDDDPVYCRGHGGGTPFMGCQIVGCLKPSLFLGMRCQTHGGGMRCQICGGDSACLPCLARVGDGPECGCPSVQDTCCDCPVHSGGASNGAGRCVFPGCPNAAASGQTTCWNH